MFFKKHSGTKQFRSGENAIRDSAADRYTRGARHCGQVGTARVATWMLCARMRRHIPNWSNWETSACKCQRQARAVVGQVQSESGVSASILRVHRGRIMPSNTCATSNAGALSPCTLLSALFPLTDDLELVTGPSIPDSPQPLVHDSEKVNQHQSAACP